jgi:nicotinate-nucleotide adenylyltransferase
MRIGIFGGTFDPVHLAHLILAEQCRDQGRLDQVWFVLASRPPHKSPNELTPFEKRAEMLSLALAGNPAFRLEDLEKDRPGPSYTADTLEELCRRYPEHEFFLLIGSDALRDLPDWYEPARIVARATLLVVARPGVTMLPVEEIEAKVGVPAQLEVVEAPLVAISSSDLRERMRQGRSIRYLVPRAVEAYIQDKQLYRPSKPPVSSPGAPRGD